MLATGERPASITPTGGGASFLPHPAPATASARAVEISAARRRPGDPGIGGIMPAPAVRPAATGSVPGCRSVPPITGDVGNSRTI